MVPDRYGTNVLQNLGQLHHHICNYLHPDRDSNDFGVPQHLHQLPIDHQIRVVKPNRSFSPFHRLAKRQLLLKWKLHSRDPVLEEPPEDWTGHWHYLLHRDPVLLCEENLIKKRHQVHLLPLPEELLHLWRDCNCAQHDLLQRRQSLLLPQDF